ncbi:MAG: transposase [Acidobacteria bacterium]|nr:transposase [Acidobacteriota bacterium]
MSRPPRIVGFSYIGPYRYFLTFCTGNRQTAFTIAAIVDQTLVQFRRTARDEAFAILAYCLMPDHVHLLVEGLCDDSGLRRFAKLAKQRSGAAFALSERRPLWQEGFHDHVLRADEDAKAVARYILANPVRAGLVVSPGDYPHSGSDVWTMADLIESVR